MITWYIKLKIESAFLLYFHYSVLISSGRLISKRLATGDETPFLRPKTVSFKFYQRDKPFLKIKQILPIVDELILSFSDFVFSTLRSQRNSLFYNLKMTPCRTAS